MYQRNYTNSDDTNINQLEIFQLALRTVCIDFEPHLLDLLSMLITNHITFESIIVAFKISTVVSFVAFTIPSIIFEAITVQ